MYYLQSRYYDPEVGRFINADALVSTGYGMLGFNMFAYCNNNPASFEDSSGYSLRPSTVAMNDGGYAKVIVETDDDPKSDDLSDQYDIDSIPESDGTVRVTVCRDGYYTYDPLEAEKRMFAILTIGAALLPDPFAECALVKALVAGAGAYGFVDTILTALGISQPIDIYDRYCVAETWTTVNQVIGRDDIIEQTTYYMESYYYVIPGKQNKWIYCGTEHSFYVEYIVCG